MYRPKRLLMLAIALLVLGGLTARAIAPLASAALASAAENTTGWLLVMKATSPAWLVSVCPGLDCAARLAPPGNAGRSPCGAPSMGISAGIVPCAPNATVTLTQLGAEVSSAWAVGLASALGGAGIVVLSAVIIFAARLR
jgi:hypothetical protein